MKKILSLAVVLSGISFATIAQEAPKQIITKEIKEGRHHKSQRNGDKQDMMNKTPEEIAKFRTDKLDKRVKLTDKQRQEVYALNLNNAKARKEHKATSNKDQKSHEAVAKAYRDQLNKILTPEQQKLMPEKQERRSNGEKNSNKRSNLNTKKTDTKVEAKK